MASEENGMLIRLWPLLGFQPEIVYVPSNAS